MKTDYLHALNRQLKEMERYTHFISELNPEVSKVSVGWHLSHNLKVINNVITALVASKPEEFKKEFNLKRFLVLLTGRIPRGKARAPKAVLPDDHLEPKIVLNQIHEANEKLKRIDTLPKNAFFQHPFFNHINRDQTKKFLVIHTEHHLKIIRDILKGK